MNDNNSHECIWDVIAEDSQEAKRLRELSMIKMQVEGLLKLVNSLFFDEDINEEREE